VLVFRSVCPVEQIRTHNVRLGRPAGDAVSDFLCLQDERTSLLWGKVSREVFSNAYASSACATSFGIHHVLTLWHFSHIWNPLTLFVVWHNKCSLFPPGNLATSNLSSSSKYLCLYFVRTSLTNLFLTSIKPVRCYVTILNQIDTFKCLYLYVDQIKMAQRLLLTYILYRALLKFIEHQFKMCKCVCGWYKLKCY
jgi:hypothetical protein